MWAQLTLIMSVIILLSFGLIISTSFFRQTASFEDEYNASTQTILKLEIANLEQYIRDLRSFCVQPCLNVPVYNSLLKTTPLTAEEEDGISMEIQSAFHSRTDLLSYSITALNQKLRFERPAGGQHVLLAPTEDLSGTKEYLACGSNEKYEYLSPPVEKNSFFRYYHYLIRIRDRAPISLSYADIDQTQLKLILKNHHKYEETLCLYNAQGELLYSNLTSGTETSPDTETQDRILQLFHDSFIQSTVSLNGKDYLTNRCLGTDTGLVLVSLLPKSVLAGQAGSFLRPMILQTILISLLLTVIVTAVIRMITVPLSSLSAQMNKMGQGDFSAFSSQSGCRETEALTASYNDMAARINELIETNYISSINEKNARLQALEAQLNPHFLYNTLQAIATEALLADRPEIYDMIVSLADNLRYTIKEKDMVPLEDEMHYVSNYILLQKTRLGARLSVEKEIQPQAGPVFIPKISIQMLVENAIIHGMPQDGSTLHISIRAVLEETFLSVTVYDDGTGIDAKKLEELNASSGKTDSSSIGLSNLASRLRILYQGNASLVLHSEENRYTQAEMRIPVR